MLVILPPCLLHLQSESEPCVWSEDGPFSAQERRTLLRRRPPSGDCRDVEALRSALALLHDPLIAYAVKANPNSAVIATLAKTGLGADVVSGGEYQRARAAGVPGGKIVFSGVGKTEEEMVQALDGGVYQFNLESVDEAETLSAVATRMGRTAPVGFRVNPDIAAGGHAKI